MSLALDGHVHGTLGTGNSFSVSLTTTGGSGQIVVAIATNNTSVTSVTATGLTFLQRKATTGGFGWNVLAEYVAPYTTNFSGNITITLSGTQSCTVDAWGISGADTTASVTSGNAPFDANASMPYSTTNNAVSGASTSTANDFIYAIVSSPSTDTAGTGWTLIPGSGANYLTCQYQIVSSTQTGLSGATGSGTGNDTGSILDAIRGASGGSPVNNFWQQIGPLQPTTSLTWIQTPQTIPPPNKPYNQIDWPNPTQPYRLDETWLQSAYPGSIPSPNKPLNQTNWPNPAPLPYFDRSWICYQPSNTLPPTGFPFNQRNWPLPVQPNKLDIQTWIESGNGFPPFPVQGFNQKDWPNPRTYSPIEQTWIHSSFPVTIPPPNKPFNTTDWPLPVQPSRLDATWTETGNAYYAVPRPFVQSDWPLTPGYTPIDLTWIVEGIGGGIIQPFSQTDWPLTGRYYTPDSTWAFFNDALYSAPVIPVPRNQYDWQLPTQPYRQEYTWIVTPKVIPPPNRPFNQSDWPVPIAPPRLDATWKLGLIPNTIPFNQYTWPNPGAYPRPDETWICTHVFTPTAQIPFNQYDWPVPNGYPRPDETYVFFNPNTQQVLLVPLPLIKQFTDLTPPLPYRIDASWINQIPQLTPVPPAPVQPQGGGIYPSEWWDAYANLIKHPKSPTVVPSHSEEVKNAAAALSGMGAKAGGLARAKSLTSNKRSAIASLAAKTRWSK